VVVSSVTPFTCAMRVEYQVGSWASFARMAAKRMVSSSEPGVASTDGSFSALVPRWRRSVASPPSSRIMLEWLPSGHSKIRWV